MSKIEKLIQKYIGILKIELADLRDNLEDLVKEAEDDANKKYKKVSNYVSYENLSVYKNELFGINNVFEDINNLDLSKYKDLDELYLGLKSIFKSKFKKLGLDKAGYAIIKRKLKKVMQYVLNQY